MYEFSSTQKRLAINEMYPFGTIALIFVSLSIFATLFLKHPSNTPEMTTFADYLLIMGIASMIPILARGFQLVNVETQRISILGFFLSFLIGLGLVALIKNVILSTYSVAGVQTEVVMLFVATIEEVFFRVALPSMLFYFVPKDSNNNVVWLAGVAISSIAFGFWHIHAYNASDALMLNAMLAGVVLSFGYRFGAWTGGGDLAFMGIVGGHYFWNLTASGIDTAIYWILFYFFIITALMYLINPHFRKSISLAVPEFQRRFLS